MRKLKRKIASIVPLVYRLAFGYKGSFAQKLKYLHYAKLAKKNGVVDFRIDRLASEYTLDWYSVDNVSKEDKEWFCQRGYAPRKINWVGITKENYRDYISNFEFYAPKTYVKDSFVEFFENKLHTYMLLASFKKNLPTHYWYVENGSCDIYPLDVECIHNGSYQDIVDLIDKKPIVAKACYGGHGKGFMKFEKIGQDKYLINNEEVNLHKLIDTIKSLNKYIITDYCYPGKTFAELCGKEAYGVIRVMLVNDDVDGTQFCASVIRCGCKSGGLLTDFPGTIYCGLTLDEGVTFDPRMTECIEPLRSHKITNHPDTGKNMEGVRVPNWADMVKLIKQVAGSMPWIKYIVMDIIPSDDGFKILEINSHGQTWVLEPHYPYLKNKYVKKAFNIK